MSASQEFGVLLAAAGREGWACDGRAAKGLVFPHRPFHHPHGFSLRFGVVRGFHDPWHPWHHPRVFSSPFRRPSVGGSSIPRRLQLRRPSLVRGPRTAHSTGISSPLGRGHSISRRPGPTKRALMSSFFTAGSRRMRRTWEVSVRLCWIK
jgi:hypothetical protein